MCIRDSLSAFLPVDDCVAPQVSGLTRLGTDPNVIDLAWTTNEPATSVIDYGLDPQLESSIQGPPEVT